MTNTQKTEAVLVHVKHLTKQFDVSESLMSRSLGLRAWLIIRPR